MASLPPAEKYQGSTEVPGGGVAEMKSAQWQIEREVGGWVGGVLGCCVAALMALRGALRRACPVLLEKGSSTIG